jgi:hypothetical protein
VHSSRGQPQRRPLLQLQAQAVLLIMLLVVVWHLQLLLLRSQLWLLLLEVPGWLAALLPAPPLPLLLLLLPPWASSFRLLRQQARVSATAARVPGLAAGCRSWSLPGRRALLRGL